jgi:dihydroorotase-like cyclic amidohydrolase
VGSDSDVVLVDMEDERILRNEDVVSKAGWTPFDGYLIKGRPVTTILRGEVVAEKGEVTAEPGCGRYTTAL